MSGTGEGETNGYRAEVEPFEVELMTREAGSTGDGNVLARFTVPVLLCHDDTTKGGWKVDGEAMKDDLMSQMRAWALEVTRPEDEGSE